MTQAKLLKIVATVSVASLALPLLVSMGSDKQSVATNMAPYLQIASLQTATANTSQVGGTDADPGVPTSNLPGQSVGKNKSNADGQSMTTTAPTAATPGTVATPTTPAPEPVKPAATTSAGDKKVGEYIVKDGDTYGCIAEKYYGSFEQYQEVMDANGATTVPGYAEYTLNVGAKLVLPAVSAANLHAASSLCK